MGNRRLKENLKKANEAVRAQEDAVRKGRFRQHYHFMAPSGWINDPNGLIQFKGKYHLFYQYNPYAPHWGEMYWGHAVSRDLVKWEHLPVALAPSEPYDDHERGGCFSGSAVDDSGTLALLYTGMSWSGEKPLQQQCLALSTDGINFYKYEGNPVIPIPYSDVKDFRDPKVFRHGNLWYTVIGSCRAGYGKALLYRSVDLQRWEYVGILAESHGELGTMWECPDFFKLNGKDVLMFSPIGVGDRKTVYLTGRVDWLQGRFFWSSMGETDWGFDFYAPQSFQDNHGRRILLGWSGEWEWMSWWRGPEPTRAEGWCGFMSLPRTAELCSDGRLRFSPLEELKALRKKADSMENLLIVDSRPLKLPAGDGIHYELEATIDLTQTDASRVGFRLRCSESERTEVVCDLQRAELIFDRSHADRYSEGVRRCSLESANTRRLCLHIFVDTCSIEIFTDGGRTVMSSNIYPDSESTGLYLFAENGSARVGSLTVWELASIWE